MGSTFANARKGRLLIALSLSTLALGLVVVTVATSHAQPSCEPIGGSTPAAERTVRAPDTSPLPGSQSEVTQFFSDGRYQVTRCDSNGDVQVQQAVGPVPVPGGQTAMLPLASFRRVDGRLQGTIPTYPDPSVPATAEAWQSYGKQLLATVVPPTEDPGQ